MTLSFLQSFQEVKALNVNKELKELCVSKNVRYVEYGNIHPRNHLNRSKLYFNFHGNNSFLNSICKYLETWQFFECCNEKEGNGNIKTNSSYEKNDYVNCNRKDIESSSNNLANCDVSSNTNTKNLEFCINNDITNKADINKVMDENPCKIYQESEESKSREVNYSIEDFSSLLRDISRKNMNRMKICQLSQLNMNSITNKFDLLVPAVVRNLDILLIRKTKIDSSFPEPQFENVGFATPYRADRDCHRGDILLYIRQDIPSTL